VFCPDQDITRARAGSPSFDTHSRLGEQCEQLPFDLGVGLGDQAAIGLLTRDDAAPEQR
jgi:hypothetical protein